MQAETQAHIETIKTAIDLLRKHVDFEAASARLVELEELSADGDFWNDQAAAQEAMREKNRLQRQVTMITDLQTELDDAAGLIELGEMEGDADVVAEAEEVIASLVTIAEKRQLESLLSGEADGNDCFLKSMQALAEPRPRTGRRCWSACTAAGASGAVSSWK